LKRYEVREGGFEKGTLVLVSSFVVQVRIVVRLRTFHSEKMSGEKVCNGARGGSRLCCLGCNLGGFGRIEIEGMRKWFEMNG
jgi:hypothetical protein